MKSLGFGILLVIFIFCAPLIVTSEAQTYVGPIRFYNGEVLSRVCQENVDTVSRGICLGYIRGVLDGLTSGTASSVTGNEIAVRPLCFAIATANEATLR
jgi:hypothetical protein